MSKKYTSYFEFCKWKIDQLKKGGDISSLNFLLNIYLTEKYHSKIINSDTLYLTSDLKLLEDLWDNWITLNIPIQYFAGFSFWRDLKLIVSEEVLIPRPETELIIEIASEKVRNFYDFEKGAFLDLGTGSGAILTAFSKSFPAWDCTASDISKSALNIAKKNLKNYLNDKEVDFIKGNWWEPFSKTNKSFDIIVSNPPYVPQKNFLELDKLVKNFEPKIALFGGLDGMDAIRKIINGANDYLNNKGWLIIENHFDQSQKVCKIMHDNGFVKVRKICDDDGIERFVEGQKSFD